MTGHIDNNLPMLQHAARRRQGLQASARMHLCAADARRFSLDLRFKLIIVPFTSYGHFVTDESRHDLLGCLTEHLAPGGDLVIDERAPHRIEDDLAEPDKLSLRRRVPWTSARQHPQAASATVGLSIPDDATLEIWRSTRWDARHQIRACWDFIDIVEPGGSLISRAVCRVFIRVTSIHEMVSSLEAHGFNDIKILGGFDGRAYDDTDPESNDIVVYVARRE